MPLNARNPEYSSSLGAELWRDAGPSETSPLLGREATHLRDWQPLGRQELEAAAGGAAWRRVRYYLLLLFWLSWVTMLVGAVAIIAVSPTPEPVSLQWWQKCLFHQVRVDEYEKPQQGSEVSEQLVHLKSLGIGALIVEGAFNRRQIFSVTQTTHIQDLLVESEKAGVEVVMDFCEVDLSGRDEVTGHEITVSNYSALEEHTLRFWLEKGVAGFLICDTDAAYSEKTLLEWKGMLKEFSVHGKERILIVKQTTDVFQPLNMTGQNNGTLVDVVMQSIWPKGDHRPSLQEVAETLEKHLEKSDDVWQIWTLGGGAYHELKRLLLVIMMTLPCSPVIQPQEDFDDHQTQSLDQKRKSATALFTLLSHSRAREEALMYGSFTFLPFNNFPNISTNSTQSSLTIPLLAFLRSWGCVDFLVLLNVAPEPQPLDPAWTPTLPDTGVFVASSQMNRFGSTALTAIQVQPNEAVVLKLINAGSYS